VATRKRDTGRKKKKSTRRRRSTSQGKTASTASDPYETDSVLEEEVSLFEGVGGGNTPRGRAQEILDRAFDADGEERIRLAKKALAVYPDCADAYVLMAENAPTLHEAATLYEQGMMAGQRAVGAERFKAYAGRFWDLVEARPYLRARMGLAGCLWSDGRCEEAVSHYREMLRLNPDDNQGVRYLLVSALFNLGQHEQLAGLLKTYGDDASTVWAYSKALLAFRKEGDSERARRLIRDAYRSNRHVPDFLLGYRNTSKPLPEYVAFGHESEAIAFAANFMEGWKTTPGAVAWLRKALRGLMPPPATL